MVVANIKEKGKREGRMSKEGGGSSGFPELKSHRKVKNMIMANCTCFKKKRPIKNGEVGVRKHTHTGSGSLG